MSEEKETAVRYRQRAEELRVIAADDGSANRTAILKIAEDYERMADTLDGIARSDEARNKRSSL